VVPSWSPSANALKSSSPGLQMVLTSLIRLPSSLSKFPHGATRLQIEGRWDLTGRLTNPSSITSRRSHHGRARTPTSQSTGASPRAGRRDDYPRAVQLEPASFRPSASLAASSSPKRYAWSPCRRRVAMAARARHPDGSRCVGLWLLGSPPRSRAVITDLARTFDFHVGTWCSTN